MKKQRLDVVLVQRALAPSRAKAQALIMAGAVQVEGQPHVKAGLLVDPAVPIHIRQSLPYVGRGGLKLAHALDAFQLDPSDVVGLDVGACTGGFTDVLLQRGARRVYAVDVGYGQLDWRLRQDARVVVLERTNIRYLEALPADAATAEPVQADCGVVDVSFISLALVLPAMQRLLTPTAWIVALIKPQFEAGPEHVGKGGIVRDPAIHHMVLTHVQEQAARLGLAMAQLTRSPITGAEGNVEFLAHFAPAPTPSVSAASIEQCVQPPQTTAQL